MKCRALVRAGAAAPLNFVQRVHAPVKFSSWCLSISFWAKNYLFINIFMDNFEKLHPSIEIPNQGLEMWRLSDNVAVLAALNLIILSVWNSERAKNLSLGPSKSRKRCRKYLVTMIARQEKWKNYHLSMEDHYLIVIIGLFYQKITGYWQRKYQPTQAANIQGCRNDSPSYSVKTSDRSLLL